MLPGWWIVSVARPRPSTHLDVNQTLSPHVRDYRVMTLNEQGTPNHLRGTSARHAREYAGRPLLNLGQIQATTLGHLLTSAEMTLPSAAVPGGPGVYALAYGGRHQLLQRFAANRSIVYVGKGMLRDRWSAHVASLSQVAGLCAEDFTIRVVPYSSGAEADIAERLLIDALQPVFNHPTFSGLGSKLQGASRTGHQSASPFDVLFPGRPGRAQPGRRDRERRIQLRAGVAAFPATPLPHVGTWAR